MRKRFCVTDVHNGRIQCITNGINEDTHSVNEPTVSTCLGHMVAANVNVLGPKFSSLMFP